MARDSKVGPESMAIVITEEAANLEGVIMQQSASMASIRHMTAVQIENIEQKDVEKIIESFVDTVRTCKSGKSVEVEMLQWAEAHLPKDELCNEQLTTKLLLETARVSKPALLLEKKMSRYGYALNISMAVGLTYFDKYTDYIVLGVYWHGTEDTEDTRNYFNISLGILVVPTVMSMILGVIRNSRKGWKRMVMGAVIGLLHLNPLVHGLAVWSCAKQTEDDVMPPSMFFITGNLCELLFEVLPEFILSFYFVMHSEVVDRNVVVSMVVGVASAGFTLMDNSVMFERSSMVSSAVRAVGSARAFIFIIFCACIYMRQANKYSPHKTLNIKQNAQKRGPYSHPFFGFLPESSKELVCVQLGLFLFYAGYLALGVMATTAVISVFSWMHLAGGMMVEFALLKAALRSRGQLYLNNAQPKGGKLFSGLFWVVFYLMMSVAPWAVLRFDVLFGGTVFARMIVWRVVLFVVVLVICVGQFEVDESLLMEEVTALRMIGAATGCVVIGAALFLSNVTSSRRWTFFESRQTGPEFVRWVFSCGQLIFDVETEDQQRVFAWLHFHPSYNSKDDVKEWLLGLDEKRPLFRADDKKLPKGCNEFSGHSIASFFDKSLERYDWYGDEEGLLQVKTHLEKLRKKIEAGTPLLKEKGGGEDGGDGGDAAEDGGQTLKTRVGGDVMLEGLLEETVAATKYLADIAEKDIVISEKVEIIAEKDGEIAQLRAQLRAKNDEGNFCQEGGGFT